MSQMKVKRAFALVFLLAVAGAVVFGRADNYPSNEQITVGQRTSDLLLNEVLAALFQEFNETSPDNVEAGKRAISLIFHNSNRDLRLIGTLGPLQRGENDLPNDGFERAALALALQGQTHTSVERMGDQWYYRRSV